MRWLWDLVAPLHCVGCGAAGDAELCEACAEGVAVLRPPWCERCGTPVSGSGPCDGCPGVVARARSVVAFTGAARSLVLALKRRGRPGLARDIGSLMASLARREGLRPDVVCWVPGGRAAARAGFDHTQLLASTVAGALGAELRPLLRRAADGPRQADVPLAARRSNVSGRFACDRAAGHVLLTDDVLTTGATAEVCAAALRSAGAESVSVLTWARTLRRRPPTRGGSLRPAVILPS